MATHDKEDATLQVGSYKKFSKGINFTHDAMEQIERHSKFPSAEQAKAWWYGNLQRSSEMMQKYPTAHDPGDEHVDRPTKTN